MTSVNYNASATAALRTLQQTNSTLEMTQNRISTGLKIGEAKDNAAYWSISTTMKSDNKSLATVKDALGLGAATVDVAYQGLNSAKDVLDEIKSKLTAASQNGVDRKAIQAEIDALQDQLKSIAGSSTFTGENWLSVDSSVPGYTSSKSVVASFSRDANNAVSIGTINVATANVALFDAGTTGTGILDGQVALTKADGTALTVGGKAAEGAAPAFQGLSGASATLGQDVGALAAAKVSLGTFSAGGLDYGDTLSFDLTVDGATKNVQVKLSGLDATPTGGELATLVSTAISSAFGSAVATAAYTDNKLVVTSATSGSTSKVAVANLKTVDGNGAVSGNQGIVAKGDFGLGAKAATSAMTFSSTNLEAGDTVQFTFQYNGDTYTTATRTLSADDQANTVGYAAALQDMVNTATKVSNGATLGSGKVELAVNNPTNTTFAFRTVGTGPSQNIGILSVTLGDASGGTTTNDGGGLVAGAVASDATGAADATPTVTLTYAQGTAGDRLSFDMTVYVPNADDSASVATKKTVVVNSSADATRATMLIDLQKAVDTAFGKGIVTVGEGGAGEISITTTTARGPRAGIAITTAVGSDGNGSAGSTLGLTTSALSNTGRDLVTTATKATITASSSFGGPAVYDDGDAVSFDISLNGVSKSVVVNKATIDAALGTTNGTIADANAFAVVMNKALANAGLDTSLVASNDNGVLKIEARNAGAANLEIANVATTSGGQTVSVDDIDITSTTFTSLTDAQQKDVLSAYIGVVNQAINKVTSAASSLGAIASRIELQKTFVDTVMDTIDKGVSGLIDADMSEESTKLQALQVKQQLGVQALSIANQSSQNILRLFQ